MRRDPQTPVLVKNPDGSVHRRAVCQCGKTIYKKNVTTGEYILHQGNYATQLLPGGVQGEYIFKCDCGIGHIVRNIKEGMSIGDNHEEKIENV